MRSACAHTCKTSYLFLSHTVERPQKIPIEVHNYHYQLQQQTATDRRDSRCTTTYHYMQHLNTFSSTHCVQSTVVPQVQPLWRRSQENAKATILLFSKSPVQFSNFFKLSSELMASSTNTFKGMMQDGTRIIVFIRTAKTQR